MEPPAGSARRPRPEAGEGLTLNLREALRQELRVERNRRLAALLLLAAALGLAAVGQFYFFRRREYLWDGVVYHGLAALCFVLAWRQGRRKKPQAARQRALWPGTWLRERPIPAVLMSAGLFLCVVATLLLQDRALEQSTGDVVVLWVMGIGAVVLAALWPLPTSTRLLSDWRASLRRTRRATWLEAASVVGLTVLAFVLRAAALDRVPFTLGGDEAWHGLLARQVLQGQLRNPFAMGYMSMPTAFYWPISWSLWLVGDGVAGLRLPAALVGTLTVPALYLFTRRLWGRRLALLSAGFLATYDYHVHYSRLGANNVWDPLFVLLALWALDRGLTGSDAASRTRSFILAGLVMGLSTYYYTGARLLPLLVIIYVGFLWVQKRVTHATKGRITNLGWHLLLLAVAFLAVAGPMLSYALSHPDKWNARVNQVGIFQSGWLDLAREVTGHSTPYLLADQFVRAAGAFHVFPDRTAWYSADRPLLGPLAGLFAVLGMAWAVTHLRDRGHFLLVLWFWAVIVTGGMLTESPPSSQRLVIASPAVALLVAIGLEQAVILAGRVLGPGRWPWQNLVLGALALSLAVANVQFYFLDFSPSRRYGSENGETATMIGHYLRELEGEYQIFFFGAPRIYWNFGTMSFLAPHVPGEDVLEPLEGPPDFGIKVEGSRSLLFLFLPERTGELAWVQQAWPDGRLREFRDAAGRVRFTTYKVPWDGIPWTQQGQRGGGEHLCPSTTAGSTGWNRHSGACTAIPGMILSRLARGRHASGRGWIG